LCWVAGLFFGAAEVTKLELECPPPRSAARLLDKLCGHYIEDHIVTFQNKNAEGLDAC
jgi:hypothetical protein